MKRTSEIIQEYDDAADLCAHYAQTEEEQERRFMELSAMFPERADEYLVAAESARQRAVRRRKSAENYAALVRAAAMGGMG